MSWLLSWTFSDPESRKWVRSGSPRWQYALWIQWYRLVSPLRKRLCGVLSHKRVICDTLGRAYSCEWCHVYIGPTGAA